jgi:hypothetical protein
LRNAALSLAVLVLSGALASCASPAAAPLPATGGGPSAACASRRASVPCFGPDGRLRRDAATAAPVYSVPREAVAARAPRFNDDGTVSRDPETGLPLYDEVVAGAVVRVLVALP